VLGALALVGVQLWRWSRCVAWFWGIKGVKSLMAAPPWLVWLVFGGASGGEFGAE